VALLAAAALASCAEPIDSPGSPTDGLRACPGAGPVVGIFTGREPTPAAADGPTAAAFDAWALEVGGGLRRLTDDGVHLAGVISPDGRTAYLLRSTGRVLGDSVETPGVVERLDVVRGNLSRMAELPGIVDLAVSGDGGRLAAAHTVRSDPGTGPDVNGITILDIDAPDTAVSLPRASDVDAGSFSAVTDLALDADGDRVAYALAVEVRPGRVVNTLRIRDVASGTDTVVHTAEGTDFVSEVVWSADDTTVVAAIRHQEPGDAVESPARFRTLRVELPGGRTSVEDGLAQDISPASPDGSRLLGLAPERAAAGEPPGRALVSWTRSRDVTGRLDIDRGARELSIAACSYR
jgi:hypothetical protein